MLEVVAIVRSFGDRENGCELRYRGGGEWLMRVDGDLVENFRLGVSERDMTRSVSWGQTNPILSWKRQMRTVCVQMLWLPEPDVLARVLGGELSGMNWMATSPDWSFPVIIMSRSESWHGLEGGRENALG